MMGLKRQAMRRDLLFFFILMGAVALGNGMSDSVYDNFFRDAYNVTTTQRAFIELPRELPGLLCALVIAALSLFGDLKTAILAQGLAFVGLLVLGLCTPPFAVMLIFLFINSLGMHMFMPLQDAIGMSLAEPDKIGKRMGQYGGFRTAVGFVAGVIIFVGVRSGNFSFSTSIKPVFLFGSAAFLIAIGAAVFLEKYAKMPRPEKKHFKLGRPRFRREYRYFYLLTIIYGVQKQISYVYGGWVIVNLLLKGADVKAVLAILTSFIGIFFMELISRWFDRLGIKRMMHIYSLAFIGVYALFGFVVWGIVSQALPSEGWPVMVIYFLFVLDRMSMQLGIIRSVYLRSIAVDESEVTDALSTGISLDHIVSIVMAQICGLIWVAWGPHWVFFIASLLSFGNLLVARRIDTTPHIQAMAANDPGP